MIRCRVCQKRVTSREERRECERSHYGKYYWQQDKYEQRKADGLCVLCGNPRENLERTRCESCRERDNRNARNYWRLKHWGNTLANPRTSWLGRIASLLRRALPDSR